MVQAESAPVTTTVPDGETPAPVTLTLNIVSVSPVLLGSARTVVTVVVVAFTTAWACGAEVLGK
jgi:hypothetical protein